MIKKVILLIVFFIIILNMTFVNAVSIKKNEKSINSSVKLENNYGIQWEMNFGRDDRYGARYEGPQPIGDTDNDGLNELLVSGRDNKIRIFEWNSEKQTYLETNTLFPPFYPNVDSDAGGMAIGDLTGDGKNEIGATWNTAVHKYINGKYQIIGFNPYIFSNGGGNGDCLIGDYDNDGKNELIMSGGPLYDESPVGEIVCFEWKGVALVKEAEWHNPSNDDYTYIYMAGIGDVDDDDENEIVCGSSSKVWVLDWDKNQKSFKETIIKETQNYYYPFACICKDSDNDGKNEIHVSYWSPAISVFEWDGEKYETKFETEWPEEGILIEALDVGNVDDDEINEVCAGTNLIHILQWDGDTYIEENILPTFGNLAVLNIGDCDNDGKNEIHAGSVITEDNKDYMSWIFKFGIDYSEDDFQGTGRLKVTTSSDNGKEIYNASIAIWNLETKTWYDIQPQYSKWSTYYRYNLPKGEYLLRVHINDYEDKEVYINIVDGEETKYDFILEKKAKEKNIFDFFSTFLTRLLRNLIIKI